MEFDGRKFVMTANMERMRPVYAYPSLEYVGEWPCDMEPSNDDCPNGRVFTAWAETPESCPWHHVMLTMDRQAFPACRTRTGPTAASGSMARDELRT